MNNKITFPELVDNIAELTNTSKRTSELFLKELFGTIKERLEQGETVKVKNLGVFKVVEIASRKSVNVNTGEELEIPSHNRISFTPDKVIAEAINMPFDGFETIILDDNITEKELKELASLDDGELDSKNEIKIEENDEMLPPPFVENALSNVNETSNIETEQKDASCENKNQEETATAKEDEEINDISDNVSEVNNEPIECFESDREFEEKHQQNDARKSFVLGFTGGILLCILIGVIAIAVCRSCFMDFLLFKDSVSDSPKTELKIDSDVVDTAMNKQKKMQVTTDVPKIVVDTVRVNYYLTKMSRKHYGRYEFWVYIYEDNKDKIANPNKIAPGLEVVIPPADKYGIDKNNEESVKKAKLLAEKIL